ncbi:predicted D-glycerate permease [Arenibacter palladensis]|uniref:Predicted D-glycerate permease n=1 Tax=Arenibacter palladensis TaxID=237373 RepID=A0A1M5FYP0_9FLAO|nr:SLC13 family permease [Arenibacter palladensis]SHF96677.1 predicted D-glycerate permease [Arenibacter palladensis]
MYTIILLLFCIAFIIVASTRFKLHPFLALLAASLLFGIFSGLPLDELIKTINDGFGGTIGGIGIIIIAGLIIGTFMEKSGGAYTLANLVLKIIGPKRVHMAMGFIGYFVSIPVFADSGFIIVSPLNRALTKKAKLSLAGTAVALSLGLMASHTMVPPTPGPIAAAGILGADLGQVILFGLMTSVPALLVCILFAKKIGSKIFIDPSPKLTEEQINTQLKNAPSVFKSFIPIVVPIILIVLRSFAEYPTMPFGDGTFKYAIGFVGNPVVALLIGMVLSFTLPKKLDKEMLSTSGWIGEALTSAAIIILITGAGGAFGKVLQTSDISSLLENNVSNGNLGIWLPFLIAAGIKTAQGSSTVAIITTASIIAPLMLAMGFDTEVSKALAVIAIGAGASLVSHANDSFFWVVTQMSDMKVNQGYRTHSLGTAILGFSAMIVLTIISLII